jgi:4-hydroxybenzoate polyprenyltransferase
MSARSALPGAGDCHGIPRRDGFLSPPVTMALASDIPSESWITRLLPRAAVPYARLMRADRPIGTWLLLFPCWWGAALAATPLPDWRMLLLFAIGAFVMRGAGCTYNDIVDREFDARVARTATGRSRRCGQREAGAGLPGGAAAGRLRRAVTFNLFSILIGIASLVLVFTYPLMKRVTWWPQFFLGLTFNWGALMGWSGGDRLARGAGAAALRRRIAWTLGYDTIYAHQDKEDDALVGVKSSARRLGDRTKPALWVFYALAVALFGAAGGSVGLAWPFWIALAALALQLGWQITAVDIDSPAHCLAIFRSNRWTGWLLFIGIVAGKVA